MHGGALMSGLCQSRAAVAMKWEGALPGVRLPSTRHDLQDRGSELGYGFEAAGIPYFIAVATHSPTGNLNTGPILSPTDERPVSLDEGQRSGDRLCRPPNNGHARPA